MTHEYRRAEPRVSFVVACYNYGRFLAQAVDSLLGQSFEAVEVIVIDDASTDDSGRVLERYATDSRVRVVRHTRNRGHICSYNEGLALARGEFIGVVAADDFCVHPDAVARQVAVFDRHPEVGFVYAACLFADENGHGVWINRPAPVDYVRAGWQEFAGLVFKCDIPHSGTLVRRSCHEEIGFYNPRLPHAGDWEMWLRLAARWSVGYIAEPLFAYRIHSTNMHHSRVSPRQATAEHVLTVENAFKALPPEAPEALQQLRPAALRRAHLRSSAIECSSGRTRRAWVGLADAVQRQPRLLRTSALYVAVAKIVVLTVCGHATYNRLAAHRRVQVAAAGEVHAVAVT
jgi:glycosyltransferase involved in cell wall biosynthesis